jgi:hypothetical protein
VAAAPVIQRIRGRENRAMIPVTFTTCSLPLSKGATGSFRSPIMRGKRTGRPRTMASATAKVVQARRPPKPGGPGIMLSRVSIRISRRCAPGPIASISRLNVSFSSPLAATVLRPITMRLV